MSDNIVLLSDEVAISLGYSSDREERKRQHLEKAGALMDSNGFFNGYGAKGSTFAEIAEWHKFQADNL